jgi:hypothetical protein
VLSRWAVHFEAANRHLIFKNQFYHTPLLAAEGFLILRIQIQGLKVGAISKLYGQLADQTGEFA